MFESRLRAAWHQNQKDKHSTVVNSRFAATPTLYRNRAHTFVLQRNKENGALLAQKKHTEALNALYVKKRNYESSSSYSSSSASSVSVWTSPCIDDIFHIKRARYNQESVQKEITQLEKIIPEKQWYERIQHLKPEFVASLAVLNHASGASEELFTIDSDRCDCGRIFRFNCVTHMNTCDVCQEPRPVLIAAEDVQTENIATVASPTIVAAGSAIGSPIATTNTPKNTDTTTTTTTSMALVPLSRKRSAHNNNMANSPKTASANALQKELAAYEKYLLQFAPDACELPSELWTKLYESLASMHLFNSLRCKPVPVAKILKDNQLQMYCSHSVRITKLFNGDPVPILSHELILRLVNRLRDVRKIALLLQQRQENNQTTITSISSTAINLPGHEVLTHFFLLAEQQPKLASAFSTHKTLNVSQNQTQKFQSLLEMCAKTSELNWQFALLEIEHKKK